MSTILANPNDADAGDMSEDCSQPLTARCGPKPDLTWLTLGRTLGKTPRSSRTSGKAVHGTRYLLSTYYVPDAPMQEETGWRRINIF